MSQEIGGVHHAQGDDGARAGDLAREIALYETASPPWHELDADVADLVRAFTALPGIVTTSSCAGHLERGAEWHIAWALRSADPAVGIADAGPHRHGWLTTEFLLWLTRELAAGGVAVRHEVSGPDPLITLPGRGLWFWIRGRTTGPGSMPPQRFLHTLRQAWNAADHHTARLGRLPEAVPDTEATP